MPARGQICQCHVSGNRHAGSLQSEHCDKCVGPPKKTRRRPLRIIRPLTGSPQGLCHRSGGFQPSTPILPGPPAASLTVSALVYLMLLLTSCGAKKTYRRATISTLHGEGLRTAADQ